MSAASNVPSLLRSLSLTSSQQSGVKGLLLGYRIWSTAPIVVSGIIPSELA
ncbi:hypothetical protein Mnod_8083 (plasmid) [Methylobacterium nodulans ORS 2060]|uniref:Uncharacterized protein n=1 Tax=Methylobacterium nodulans (strain LMG 21967 / CNCM I-2342 / ORS 2060) TaxID=460265 RepID=B8IX30_METNO|nr:hypothetical protein Mnod_8083 [Methylobacterium nodulans ORS 2060]